MLHRDQQPEMMDDPGLSKPEHQHALAGLSRLNRFSGVSSAMYRRIRRYLRPGDMPVRILDVASGSGDVAIAWAKQAKREGLSIEITSLDISEVAMEEQQRRARLAGVQMESIRQDCLNTALPGGYDVITCSLFMHHLDDRSVTRLLQSMKAAAERAVLICDLERSSTNLVFVGAASRLLSRSSVVHHDALLSVRGAYTRVEFKSLAEAALLQSVRVERSFPCRFMATIDEVSASDVMPAFA